MGAGPQPSPVSRPIPPVFRVLLANDSRPFQEFVRIVMKQSALKQDIGSNGEEPDRRAEIPDDYECYGKSNGDPNGIRMATSHR